MAGPFGSRADHGLCLRHPLSFQHRHPGDFLLHGAGHCGRPGCLQEKTLFAEIAPFPPIRPVCRLGLRRPFFRFEPVEQHSRFLRAPGEIHPAILPDRHFLRDPGAVPPAGPDVHHLDGHFCRRTDDLFLSHPGKPPVGPASRREDSRQHPQRGPDFSGCPGRQRVVPGEAPWRPGAAAALDFRHRHGGLPDREPLLRGRPASVAGRPHGQPQEAGRLFDPDHCGRGRVLSRQVQAPDRRSRRQRPERPAAVPVQTVHRDDQGPPRHRHRLRHGYLCQ